MESDKSSTNKVRRLLSKVFSFVKPKPKPHKEEDKKQEIEKKPSEKRIFNILGQPKLELDAIKTLILDLSWVLKDNPQQAENANKVEFEINIFDDGLTSGWLVWEVMRKYSEYISKLEASTGNKMKKKLIVAIKVFDNLWVSSRDQVNDSYNESLNYWITQYERSLIPLKDGQRIVPHFSKYLPNRK
jgi:hypothetical protein